MSSALESRLAEFRSVLLSRCAARLRKPKTAPATDAAGMDASALADAVADALARFTDEDGALRVRTTNGATPYGGGGS